MSDINLKCPVPQCTYETGSASEMVAVALLAAHTTVHSTAATRHAPKLDRPQIDVGVSAEEWRLFESRWKLYAKSSSIGPDDLVHNSSSPHPISLAMQFYA